jgi:hypothetical protein
MADLTQITSPSGVKFTVAKDAADAFSGFLTDLEGAGYKIDQKTSGGYNPRNIAGTDTPSQHAFGRAIDINPAANARGAKTSSDLPANVNDIAAAHGLTWGGTWSGDTRDPMHFELSGKPTVAADTGPSADDLLKRMDRLAPAAGAGGGAATGAAPAPAQDEGPSGDDLLRRMEGLAPAAAAPPPPGPTPRFDDYGRPIGPDTPDVAAGQAIGESYRAAGSLHNWLAPAPDTEYSSTPLVPFAKDTKTGKIRLALPGPLRDFLYSVTGDLSEGMTADTTTGRFGTTPEMGSAINLLAGAGARPLRFGSPVAETPLIEREAPLSPEFKANALTPEAQATATRPPTAPTSPTGIAPPATGAGVAPPATGAGVAQPAGAMVTPPPAAARTAREIGHGNTVADEEWLNTPQQPGVRDTRVLVGGNTPTLAEQEQTVTTARELKRLRNDHTEVSQEERQLLHDASENRKTAFKEAVPSDLTLNADEAAAGKKIESDLQSVWANKGKADAAPVNAQITTELSGSAGDLPPVKSAMGQVSSSLENAGDDPQAMYRTHRLINYLQSKQGQVANPGYGAADVQAALTRVKGVLAQQIDTAAPGFASAMKSYSDTIGPIRAAQALNERYSDLFDTRGYMNFNSVHRLMKDIIQAGHPDAPTSDLRGISDFQLQQLKNIHDDLRRSASAQDLAKAYGSDTAQNVMDIIKGVGKTAGSLAVRGAAAYALGPAGPFAVEAAGRIMGARRAAAGKAAGVARGREILRPPPNLLEQPPP